MHSDSKNKGTYSKTKMNKSSIDFFKKGGTGTLKKEVKPNTGKLNRTVGKIKGHETKFKKTVQNIIAMMKDGNNDNIINNDSSNNPPAKRPFLSLKKKLDRAFIQRVFKGSSDLRKNSISLFFEKLEKYLEYRPSKSRRLVTKEVNSQRVSLFGNNIFQNEQPNLLHLRENIVKQIKRIQSKFSDRYSYILDRAKQDFSVVKSKFMEFLESRNLIRL